MKPNKRLIQYFSEQPTKHLVTLISAEGTEMLKDLARGEDDIRMYEMIVSLAKRELSLRGVLDEIVNDDYGGGYGEGDPANWWKP